MSRLRQVAAIATDLACSAVGRRNVVRAARFVLLRARLDVPNDLHSDGESALQRWVLGLSMAGQRCHVIDVGANVGQWSAAMIAAARQAGRLDDLNLHAFEPSSFTFGLLSQSLDGQPVRIHQAALSAEAGSSVLYLAAPGAGTNSLHRSPGALADAGTEDIITTTLDAFADGAGLDHITLVKIDTEGHDLTVLQGASRLLVERRILVIQFEYNHRWVYARSFLRDAFELLEPLGYRLGKLTPRGVEFYSGWDAELETFVEGNYVACAPGAGGLPSVTWWKTASRSRSLGWAAFLLLRGCGARARPGRGMFWPERLTGSHVKR
jgi:FkbM family methyltransferase